MTFLEAAIEILRNADDAMHFSEVARRAVDENLLSHVGRDPEAAMRSCLNSAVRSGRDGEEPIIVRHKPGYYGIRPGATLPDPPPRPEKPASAAAERSEGRTGKPATKSKKKTKSSNDDGEPAKAKSRSRRRKASDDDGDGQSESRSRRRRKTRAKGEAPAPASVEVLPVRKAAEKPESKEGGSTAKDAPAAVAEAAKAASVRNVEFEAPTGSGLEGVTDVALVMANAMSRLVEERPELKDELEALQQKEQRAEAEAAASPARPAATPRGASRAAANSSSGSSGRDAEERGGRRRRRRRRRGKRVDWSAGSERPGEATVNDKLLDGVATVLAEAGSRSLHVRQIAETLAGRGLLGGEISEIERAVTAAVMVDIHQRGRASRFVARGEARYQLQGSRLPDPAAKAEQALREAALRLENETSTQLSAWLQSLGARALESLVRIYLTRESYQLVVALPPSRGVGKLVVEDPASEDDEGRQLVLVVPKRTAVDPKLWEGELERNNCSGLTLFAMGDVPDDLSLDDARVVSVEDLSRWMRNQRVGVQPLQVDALALDATFIESIAGLDT